MQGVCPDSKYPQKGQNGKPSDDWVFGRVQSVQYMESLDSREEESY